MALRDLLSISLAVCVLLWLGAATDTFLGIHRTLARRYPDHVDQILVALVLASAGLALFAIRLWRSGTREATGRAAAESRFRTLVEEMPAVTVTWDPRRSPGARAPTYVSPQVESLFGLTAADWMSNPRLWIDRVHPGDRARVVWAHERSPRPGEHLSIEYRHVREDGQLVWVREDSSVVERDAAGRPALVQALLFDVTERRHAEEQVAETEARYRTLVERVPAVTYIWDATFQTGERPVAYISPQIEFLLGYSQAEFQDPQLWHRLAHPDDLDRVLAEWTASQSADVPFRSEYRMCARDGRVVWVRDEAVLVARDDRGRPLFQGVMFDITERKIADERLRAAERRYRSLVENLPAVTYVDDVDERATSIYVSPQVETLFGYTQREWISAVDYDAVHPEDRQRVLEAIARHNEVGEPFDMEYRFRTKDGRWRWVSDRATVVRDEQGEMSFSQGVISDVTERKLVEEALQESERREREAAERLRSLDEMKNRFLAAVSHELRSPLTSILGMAITLEQPELPDDDRSDLTGRLAANARKLERLLKDLLDIDRLSRGIVTPTVRSTDVGQLVRRTVESLDVLGERSIHVETETVLADVDPAKVERIVENLVMNAVRHTEPDVSIWVRAWPQDGGAVIAVEDEGPGVPAELREAIFEPFRQGPTASPHSPGTGIGLSLVAMFADLHGGRSWVQDREGGGASFRVFLPAAAPSDGNGDTGGRNGKPEQEAETIEHAGAG